MSRPIRVGITHGDINGIGYEVIMKAIGADGFADLCTPVVFGTARLISFYRKHIGITDFSFKQIESAENIVDGEINVVNISNEEWKVTPGVPSAEGGAAALLSLEKALDALAQGDIDVLVTAPIDKNAIQGDGFCFPGHTEYLRARCGGSEKSLMILFDDHIRVALVTTHLPVSEISAAITPENVEDTIRLFDKALRSDFACERPKIAVLSLNPHCGDNGLLGSEERDVIVPVVEKCQADGLLVFGPYSADGFFASDVCARFDGVVAMYHDQGLAPFKALARENGVNFTAGLPFVRTSPDHGTAYDIAGKGLADSTSMREAIYKAIDIFRRRRRFAQASANPLRKQSDPRKADRERGEKKLERPKPQAKDPAETSPLPTVPPFDESSHEEVAAD